MIVGSFPFSRPRRLRSSGWMREMCQEFHVATSDLILPLFVREEDGPEVITSMPGVSRLTITQLLPVVHKALTLGIKAVALFPVVDIGLKDEKGTLACGEDNLVCRAIRAIKSSFPEIGVIADVALDPYTSHGQDGVLSKGKVHNEQTIELLCAQALVQAQSGCDIIAPSDMMDGRVLALRTALDKSSFEDVSIMSYGAKYASCFYGPFSDALDNKGLVDKNLKKTYQMNPGNAKEALGEIAMDIEEGADMVIVKPGMPYLDIISKVSQQFHTPVFGYQVSGEYAMLKAASQNGWIDFNDALMESLLCFKRAGACGVFTYGAIEAAEIMNG